MQGQKFRRLREAHGVSQISLARGSGLTSAEISSWERGNSDLTEDKQDRLHKTLEQKLKITATTGKPRKRFTPRSSKKRPPLQLEKPVDLRSVEETPPSSPTAIAAFAGCGGMSEGFRQAGYKLLGHIEISDDARKVYAQNFPGSECLGADINSVDFPEIAAKYPPGTVDVVIGGPPCQGFSLAGKRSESDPRNRLFEKLIALADAVRPKFVVFENVRLLTSMKNPDGRLVIDEVFECFTDHGYSPSVYLIDSSHYGVAQIRKRVIVVAIRNDLVDELKFEFPPPTHANGDLIGQPFRTFRDVAGDLEVLESGESSEEDPLHWAVDHPDHIVKILRNVPEGKSAHENDEPQLRPSSGYNTTYKRISWDRPAPTVSTNFSMISGSNNVHPSETRSLTIREAARIQSFPDDFQFFGSWGSIRTMIGNAVPPRLARAVAESIAISLKKPA